MSFSGFHYGNYVFANAGKDSNGITVTIGANVKKIPAYLFYQNSNYPNIKTLIFEHNSVCNSIGNYAFNGCNGLASITIPGSVTTIGTKAFGGCGGLTSITIPDGVTTIGDYAFDDCTVETATIPALAASYIKNGALKTVVITSGDSIGNYAFANCSSLTSITIPNSVTAIGSWAFYGCSKLTSITIPDSVTAIGGDAFSGCPIETATIPALAARYIKIYAENSTLKTLVITSGDSIDEKAFENCINLSSVTIPDSVTAIGNYAFNGCPIETATIPAIAAGYISNNKLKTVVITSGNGIGNYAFANCSSLTNITIPDSVTSIGNGAFSACSSLTSITIPDSVTSIGDSAFNACRGLKSITIPYGVTSIGEDTFYNCNSLTSITIPNSVTSIGAYAFRYCNMLISIIFNGTKEQWTAISKGLYWNDNTGNYTIHYSDDDILDKRINEITE